MVSCHLRCRSVLTVRLSSPILLHCREEVLDHSLYSWGKEIALDCRDASRGLGGNQVNPDDIT